MNIQETLFRKIAEQKGLNPESLNRDTTILDIGLDSLDMVELSMDLEDSFGITINQEDIAGIKTLGQAVEFVEKRKNGA